jgi:cysteinyl-tRNA synthetase
VNIFTCGPSVYQRSHIGNFRTFLFEDTLVRYLEYSGYRVKRGMNLTDIEDKAFEEAERRKKSVKRLTEENIKQFIQEMGLLHMKIPDYLPRASECINEAVDIIQHLLNRGIAYWFEGNVYFDPLKFPGFGKLYGLDMSRWPAKKKRFHKDTYPGIQWNLGDFILWHGYGKGDKLFWDTKIGKGRPSWNVQDPGIISKYFDETLSIYCGGIDNLFRHHDYTLAILESVRPYPMARFWLHCHHLYVNGQKMSKSKGNIYYSDTLIKRNYRYDDIRFFLIYSHYRERLNYSDRVISAAADKLRGLKNSLREIEKKAKQEPDLTGKIVRNLKKTFTEKMDNDMDVRGAFDGLYDILARVKVGELRPAEASGIIKTMKEIDKVFKVIFK